MLIRLTVLAENVCPHSSSVIALTLRVDTPWTYISASALTSAFSDARLRLRGLREYTHPVVQEIRDGTE